jgi:hypothetical protein
MSREDGLMARTGTWRSWGKRSFGGPIRHVTEDPRYLPWQLDPAAWWPHYPRVSVWRVLGGMTYPAESDVIDRQKREGMFDVAAGFVLRWECPFELVGPR